MGASSARGEVEQFRFGMCGALHTEQENTLLGLSHSPSRFDGLEYSRSEQNALCTLGYWRRQAEPS